MYVLMYVRVSFSPPTTKLQGYFIDMENTTLKYTTNTLKAKIGVSCPTLQSFGRNPQFGLQLIRLLHRD